MNRDVDPITLEIIQNALGAIADELALVIMRCAYSNIVRDSMDYSSAVCDHEGRTIAQGLTTPVHLGSFPDAMQNLIRTFGDDVDPGDVFIFNDPYGAGGMHLPDFYIVAPVFVDGRLEAYAATPAHQSDIGGIAPGGMAVYATEIFQEGLRIPALKLYEGGRPNQAIFRLIESNTRQPRNVMGDVRAQLADEAVLIMRSDRRSIPPYGLSGGLPGTPSWNVLNPGPQQRLLPVCPMHSIALVHGDEFLHIQAGAGGFGDSLERDPESVRADVINEMITVDHAGDVYGVILESDLAVDTVATLSQRDALRADGSHQAANLRHFYAAVAIDPDSGAPGPEPEARRLSRRPRTPGSPAR